MCAAPCPADPAHDPLELPSEQDVRALFATTFACIAQTQAQLAKDLELYRSMMEPLIAEAAHRISGDDKTDSLYLYRQLMTDSHLAQDGLSTCLMRIDFTHRAALALRNALNAKA